MKNSRRSRGTREGAAVHPARTVLAQAGLGERFLVRYTPGPGS